MLKYLLLLMVFLWAFPTINNAQIPLDGLVAHWPFSGNANDESSNGYNGTVNGPTLVIDRFGNLNSAYSFDGIDDYIAISSTSLVNGEDSISLSFWLKRESSDGYGLPIHTGNQGRFGIHSFKDSLLINVSTNSTSSGGSFTEFSTLKEYYNQTEWTHFVLRYDGNTLQLFINNQQITEVAASGSLITPQSSYLAFGVYMLFGNPNHGYYKGVLDDVFLYKRALTKNEISDLYYENICQEVIYETVYDTLTVNVYDTIANYNIPSDGLMGYWPFSGNANDESLNSNNGTVNGAWLTEDRFGNNDEAYHMSGMSNITTEFGGITGNNDRAISFWAKVNEDEAGGHALHYGTESGGQAFTIGLFPETNVHLDINNSTVQHRGTKVNDGNWHHYVYMFSTQFGTSLDGIRIYQDGILLTQIDQSYNYLTYQINTGATNPFAIGASSYPVEGTFDDIRIYDRTLSSSDIQNLYHETKYVEMEYDTTQVVVYDTAQVMVYDTMQVVVYDTTQIIMYDTMQVVVYDTVQLLVTVTDTLIIDYTVTSLKKDLNNLIKVYPNPTSDILIISNSNYSQMEEYSVVISDLTGKEVYQSKLNRIELEINLRDFGNIGVYLLQIYKPNGTLLEIRKLLLK